MSVSIGPLEGVMSKSWARAMESVAPQIDHMLEFLSAEEEEGRGFLPRTTQIFRAFETELDSVKVLIVGQDPYPTPTHPVGLSFSTERSVRPLPRSLGNIYRELRDDLGIEPVEHGDLSAWQDQGVMLLNRVLTVRPGAAGSHRGKGWEAITEHAIRTLAARQAPLVAILWGRQAQSLAPLLGACERIESAHPSPLSARRGFFGSRPFSRANELLVRQGATAIDWKLLVV